MQGSNRRCSFVYTKTPTRGQQIAWEIVNPEQVFVRSCMREVGVRYSHVPIAAKYHVITFGKFSFGKIEDSLNLRARKMYSAAKPG